MDGSHIRTLLLTLLYRHFRPLIDEGRVYIGQPPLYRLQLGKEVRWAYSDIQRDKAIKELKALAKAKKDKRAEKGEAEEEKPTKGRRRAAQSATNGDERCRRTRTRRRPPTRAATTARADASPRSPATRASREMNAEQLWDTTLNPLTRTLKRVTLEDAEQADFAFDELMGTEVEGRKKWIMANASEGGARHLVARLSELGIDFEHWCFACGRLNEAGLHLDFDVSRDRAETSFTPERRHEGYDGTRPRRHRQRAPRRDDGLGDLPPGDLGRDRPTERRVPTAGARRRGAARRRRGRAQAQPRDRDAAGPSRARATATVLAEADATFLVMPEERRRELERRYSRHG